MQNTLKTKSANSLKKEVGLKKSLSAGIRDYAMYFTLVVLIGIFTVMTKGNFLSPRNISDLINQTAYVAVLAIGMTLILIIKHIDLSVGFVAGFLGAVAATFMRGGMSTGAVVPLIMLIGAGIGIYQGLLVAKVGVPAFVTTLAGMFIFRGLLLRVTKDTGTIIVANDSFKRLSGGFVTDLPGERNIHLLTLLIGVVGVIIVFIMRGLSRKKSKQYQMTQSSGVGYWLATAVIGVIIMTVVWTLAKYKGLPISAIIVGIVLIIYNFMLNKTRLGRYIYGIGGNTEAAALSGVNVARITIFVFASMSMLAALSGMLYTSRLASATPAAGVGFEMEAIASSYIGGVSVNGGVGKVTNTIIGALIMSSLTNGMNLLGVDISVQYIVKGVIFIGAVAFDVISRKKAQV